jgi:hypothetical protein
MNTEYMSDRQYAAWLASEEMRYAVAMARNVVKVRALPAFTLSDGKILEPKYKMTGKTSICRAPHKNRR